MSFELPELPYAYDALDPHIDAKTMQIHHGKHHAGYVANLNTALENHSDLSEMTIEELLRNIDKVPNDIRQTVINNAGGHANHSLFWEVMSPNGGGKPSGDLMDALVKEFGSFDNFTGEFTQKAATLFGSGWIFLCVEGGKLMIKRHSFQNSPYMYGKVPILGLDVWEHAYYLKYQNKRAEYIQSWWKVVNWKEVSENYNEALKSS